MSLSRARPTLVPLALLGVAATALVGHTALRAQDASAARATTGSSAGATPSTNPLAPVADGDNAHMPYDLEECTSCHAASKTDTPGPVADKSEKLCFTCHDGVQDELADAEVEHAGVYADCVDCHNPHNSANEYLLHAPARKLCTSCHEEVADEMKAAKVAHGAMEDPASCVSCHSPHASAREALLRADIKTVCLQCHALDDHKDHDGKRLANIGKLLERPVRHKPIDDKGCAACHSPHGGERRRLLRAPYPASFYGPWSKDAYGLCFGCHEAALVEAKTTTTATGFRDGARNLHAVHVDRGERGRSCRACHETHASTGAKLVADDVPFGSHGWRLPIGFAKTMTGGSCAKTCHTVRQYDRAK